MRISSVRLLIILAVILVPGVVVAVKLTGNVQFRGSLAISGALSKGSGTFVIDHPLDPKNKLLYHSFVESPDVKNLYDGIVQLDANGEAEIELPEYFDALNKAPRYQYFPLDEAMPGLYVKDEEKENGFVIAGGAPGGRVSWQITGIRHDPYILRNPVRNEVWKGPNEEVGRGECLYEPLCE